ncbi:MAG TPA: hypothetical protein VFD46_12415 [Chryseolinea sp.]|nr:hypothetical protein [Chryseolinea sp.]
MTSEGSGRNNLSRHEHIRSTEISLSEVAKESNLILQVKFIEFFKETVPVIERPKDQTGEPILPFIKRGCVFQVLDTL